MEQMLKKLENDERGQIMTKKARMDEKNNKMNSFWIFSEKYR
jgi:hypothetical protein